MLEIEVAQNPNCQASGQFYFAELGPPKVVVALITSDRGREIRCEVAGVDAPGCFVRAHASKIADSGAGFAFLIHGGDWGLRFRPETHADEAWDLNNSHQWGEAFKVYGAEEAKRRLGTKPAKRHRTAARTKPATA